MKRLLPPALILVALVAHAQLPWPITHSETLRFTAADVAVDGDLVWTAGGWGLRLQRISDGAPASGLTVPIPGLTTRVVAAGGRAWAGSGNRIFTVRADDVRAIEHVLVLDGSVNDLLLVGHYLYAATTRGVIQIDVLQPGVAVVTRSLSTTAGGAIALASRGNRLFAADGDVSVEIYDISFPALAQRVGSFNAFPQTTSIHSAGDLLIASDGRQTRIYTAGAEPILVGTLPVGADAVVLARNNLLATAEGRRISLWDTTAVGDAVLLWSGNSPVTAGSVNRISALVGASGLVLAAAGDAGLVAVSLDGFTAPYGIQSWRSPAVGSLVASDSQVIAAGPDGGMTVWRRSDSGLERRATFNTSRVSVASDLDDGRLLSFSGAALTLWNAAVTPPVQLATIDAEAPVRAAVLRGTRAWAILSNGSAVTVDFGSATPASSGWDPQVPSPYALVRRGDDIGVAGLAGGGTSSLRIHRIGGSVSAAVPFQGAATGGIALNGNGRAALVTFAGLHLITPGAGSPVTLVQNVQPVHEITWSGSEVVLIRDESLELRRDTDGSLVRNTILPSSVSRAAVVPQRQEIVAGGSGSLVLVRLSSTSRAPADVSVPEGNRYPRELAIEPGALFVRENERVTRFRLGLDGALVPMVIVSLPQGVIGAAISGEAIWTLSSSGTISRLGWNGGSTAVASLPNAGDMVPLSIQQTAGALYVSYRRGCSAGACEKRTDVYDPATGQVTATLDGELLDISVDGAVAYGLFDLPKEIRRLDLRDPLRPFVTGSRELSGSPVSLAWRASDQRLFLLGSRLERLDPQNMQVLETWLDPWVADPSGRLSYTDQRVRLSAAGLAIAGRWFAPRIWPGASPDMAPVIWDAPAAGRRIVAASGGWILLTDSSIEAALPPSGDGRSRGVRR